MPNAEEVRQRRAQAAVYDQAIARYQDQRNAQVQAALASSATFLTLMAASATGRVEPSRPDHLVTAQFFLSLLFAGALGYCLTRIYHFTLSIADDGARRLELEKAGEITVVESQMYAEDTRGWRQRSDRPKWARRKWVLAAIPRYGESQRLTVLFAPVVALFPAAWFALTEGGTWVEGATIVFLTGVLALLLVRILFGGCRHWLWVDPRSLELTREPSRAPAPALGWWFYRQGARETRSQRWFTARRERWQAGIRHEGAGAPESTDSPVAGLPQPDAARVSDKPPR